MDPDQDRDGYTLDNSNPNSHEYMDRYKNTYTDQNRDGHSHGNQYPDGYSDPDVTRTGPILDTHSNQNRDEHAYGNEYVHKNFNADFYAYLDDDRTSTDTPTLTNTPTATFTPTPDAQIAKSVSEQVAKNNDILTYTITSTGTAGSVHNVVVTDVLPAHLNFVSFGQVPTGVTTNWDIGSRTMSWTLPAISAGQTYQFTYQAQVDNFVQQGTVLTNNAQLGYTELSGFKKASVDVRMSTLYTVHVGVYNAAGELVKEIWVEELSREITDFSITSPSITSLHGNVYVDYEGTQIAVWDGTNGDGNPVSNGDYYVKIDNVDPYGVVLSVSKVVTVSRAIAKVEVDVLNESGEVVRHLYGYEDDPANMSTMDVKFSTNLIRPTDGVVAAGSTNRVDITSSSGLDLSWDGKSDSGAIVTNGHYFIEVHYVDGKGGDATVTQGIVVQSGNVRGDVVTAQPNVLTGGQTGTNLRIISAASYTLKAQLYDLAGELIKKVTGGAGTNDVYLDMKGLASGLYIAVVELTDANGKYAGRQITKIVFQK